MSTVVTPVLSRALKHGSPKLSSAKNVKTRDTEKPNNLTPTRHKKIAPKDQSGYPNAAWGIDCDSPAWDRECKDCDGSKTDLLGDQKLTSSDEENTVLIKSRCSSSEDESQAFADLPEDDDRTLCKYIIVPGDIGDGGKKCAQYDQLLSPVSTACPSIDDDSISLDIIKNIKSKDKVKRPYLKFLCPPYFILAASLLEISVFVWAGESIQEIFVYSPHHRYQVWRFFSYMLLHSGGIHLTLNIIIQTLLATPLELEQGSWRCAAVYLGGGAAGALGASVLQPSLYMVGASAGVYALLMSHLANVLLRYTHLRYRIFRIFSVAVLAASDIAFSVAHWWAAAGTGPRIGWAAHCAGALAGATVGVIVFTGCDEDTRYIRVARWTSFGIIIVVLVVSIIFNIFFIES